MPNIEFLLTLITFYFVMYVTPGPNNSMVLASSLKFGFKKSIPVILGITIGHIIQLIIVCLGFGVIFKTYPEIQFVLKILCAAYMLYLSFKIIGSFSEVAASKLKPVRFYEAALFQIINPKAWTISSMAASGFISTEINLFSSILVIASVALLVCPVSISPWAAFGAAIRKFVKDRKVKIIIEFLLATLLVLTAILIVIQL